MTDEGRGLLMVAALLVGGGFVGGRMTAPVPKPEVRYIPIFAPVQMPAEAAPIDETPPAVPVEPTPVAPIEPPAVTAPPVEAKPLPPPRPKVEAKPQPKPERAKRPRATAPATRALPSCAAVKREYEAMSLSERMAAYRRATAREVAYGKRCLGF